MFHPRWRHKNQSPNTGGVSSSWTHRLKSSKGDEWRTGSFCLRPLWSVRESDVMSHLFPPVPCCPEDVTINLVSTETLEVTWSPVKGAELYETTAAQASGVIRCNDTAPVCALSDLRCDTVYSVVVTPCSELRGCNRTCTPQTHETGTDTSRQQTSD